MSHTQHMTLIGMFLTCCWHVPMLGHLLHLPVQSESPAMNCPVSQISFTIWWLQHAQHRTFNICTRTTSGIWASFPTCSWNLHFSLILLLYFHFSVWVHTQIFYVVRRGEIYITLFGLVLNPSQYLSNKISTWTSKPQSEKLSRIDVNSTWWYEDRHWGEADTAGKWQTM